MPSLRNGHDAELTIQFPDSNFNTATDQLSIPSERNSKEKVKARLRPWPPVLSRQKGMAEAQTKIEQGVAQGNTHNIDQKF